MSTSRQEGGPACAVYEMGRGEVSLLRSCHVPQPGVDEHLEQFRSLAVAPDGTLWISGVSWSDAPREFLLRRGRDGAWQQEDPMDAGALSIDRGGTLWLLGGGLQQRTGAGWIDVPLELEQTESSVGVLARSPKDVFVATSDRVLHFDGESLSAVPLESAGPLPSLQRIRSAGQHVWVSSKVRVWELVVPGSKGVAREPSRRPVTMLRPGAAARSAARERSELVCSCDAGDIMCMMVCSQRRHLTCSRRCASSSP